YEREPVGGPSQPDFLNVVVEVRAVLTARALLDVCLAAEKELGRTRDVRWGPRTADLDLLIYDDEVIEEPDLVVPHPRAHERAFVVLPLLELEPDPVLAGGRGVEVVAPRGHVRPWGPPLTLPR